MYTSTYDNLDLTLQFKRVYEKSARSQSICAIAQAQGNAYICQNPNTFMGESAFCPHCGAKMDGAE